ncbi:hypothetical protein DPV79_39105 [Burkholderia reimsis]|uniref:Fis family transcriptional regulator n=2 Tax=Burkholderia reimsis TaxID=2234132 RepID=A0A365QH45_9BURK|nr:hypothetical protein DPV79_39105 [Burkholderia reimsis]
MLLPLPAGVARGISLENHLALAAMRSGHGTPETMVTLLRVLYMTHFLLGTACSSSDQSLFLNVEAALSKCIQEAEKRSDWRLEAEWLPGIEAILRRFDEVIQYIPKSDYVDAWKKLSIFALSGNQSPINGSRVEGVWI